jgi:hypothetical protein
MGVDVGIRPTLGRRHDAGTVKYERDLTSLPHRLLHRLRREPETELKFTELVWDE